MAKTNLSSDKLNYFTDVMRKTFNFNSLSAAEEFSNKTGQPIKQKTDQKGNIIYQVTVDNWSGKSKEKTKRSTKKHRYDHFDELDELDDFDDYDGC